VTKWLQAPAGFDAQWSRLRGEVVVLDFWATWCAPCVHSILHLNELANEFRGQDVVFLAVTDDDEERLQSFLPKHPIDAMVGIDTEDASIKAFGLNFFGATVLVGKDGHIIGTTLTVNLTAEMLKDALAGKSPTLPQMLSMQSDPDWDKNSIEWQDGIVPLMYAIIKPIEPNGGTERAESNHITAVVLGSGSW
jgi:thiol-disulfide isomerase/thioredoxin